MSQSNQVVEQDEQAVGQIIEENAVTGEVLLGSSRVIFNFDPSKSSPRTARVPFTPPGKTKNSYIVLQGFNVEYTQTDFELQVLDVSLSIEGQTAICTATLRDKNRSPNGPEWKATVTGLLQHFGPAA